MGGTARGEGLPSACLGQRALRRSLAGTMGGNPRPVETPAAPLHVFVEYPARGRPDHDVTDKIEAADGRFLPGGRDHWSRAAEPMTARVELKAAAIGSRTKFVLPSPAPRSLVP